MAMVTFFGGITSIIISTVLYWIVEYLGYTNFQSSIGALLFIGPIEEFSKITALFILYFIFKRNMNEPMDGIIYLSSVVLGFSLIENLFYSLQNKDTSFLILTRLFISTPMHIIFSIYMGIAFYYLKKGISKFRFLILAFIHASFLHGMFDLTIFNEWILLLFIILIKLSYRTFLYLVDYAIAKSPFRKSLVQYIHEYDNPSIKKGMECLSCGSKNNKITYKLGKIKIQKCDKCSYYISDSDSIFYIFHHFGSKFEGLSKYYIPSESKKNGIGTLYKSNFISEKKKLCFFDLEELNKTLEELSSTIIKNFESNKWFKNNLLKEKERIYKPLY